ncbi:MAG TPA: dethiobiotin synthase [Pyrinomonadaceae bacterium]|nr:dethiobiotin synthase [Pyrinomonadaceae bacterium]
MHGIFVTGTDTNVGKTVVSAVLTAALREKKNVFYWKPVQTGIEADDDTRTVRQLAACADEEILDKGFRLEKPLSPHISARLAKVEISIEKILNFLPDEKDEKFWIVEGAGGALVPLNENELMIDLMKALDLPVVVVARSGLGTINHTLLTVEALRNRDLKISGVVMNGEPNAENRRAIEYFGQVKVLAEMPRFEELTNENISAWAKKYLTQSR